MDGELETRIRPQTPPEELSLFYKDPLGQVQGPFKGIDIIEWFKAEYFGIDLLVCLESAAAHSPWLQLGDVMPHLRAKARPPPGFPTTKLDTAEAPVRQSSSTYGNIHTGSSEVEMLRNNSMHRLGSATEAENKFLESVMSGSKNSPPLENLTLSEGIQGFTGNSSANLGPSELMVETTHTCWPRGWLLNDRGPYQILIHIGQGLMQHPFLQNQTLFQMHHHIQNSCLL